MKNWKSVLRTAAAALLSLSIIITGIGIPAKAEEPTSDENRTAGAVVTGLKGINLMDNPGFENGYENWGRNEALVTENTDTAFTHSGAKSYKVTAGVEGEAYAYCVDTATYNRNAAFTAGMWVYLTDPADADKVTIHLERHNAAAATVQAHPAAQSGWQRVSVDGEATTGTTAHAIKFTVSGGTVGDIYFDDAYLYCADAESINLIRNDGFESNKDAWGGDFEVTAEEAYAGNSSAKITGEKDLFQASGWWPNKASVNTGETLYFSAWVKSGENAGTLKLRAEVKADGLADDNLWTEAEINDTKGEWQQLVLTIPAPAARVSEILFHVNTWGEGVFYVDGVRVNAVDPNAKEVPPASEESRSAGTVVTGLKGINLMDNPGFENGYENWGRNESLVTENTDTAFTHSGAKSYKVTAGAEEEAFAYCTTTATYNRSAACTAGLWVFLFDAADAEKVTVLVERPAGETLSVHPAAQTGWQRVLLDVPAAENTERHTLKFVVAAGCSGDVYFDDAFLYTTDDNSVNLIRNESFESNKDAWAGEFENSAEQSHSGSFSAKLTGAQSAFQASGWWPNKASANSDGTLYLSAWVKGGENAGGIRLRAEVKTASGVSDYYSKMVSGTTEDWKLLTVAVPCEGVQVQELLVHITATGTGVFYADDLKLNAVKPQEELDDTPVDPAFESAILRNASLEELNGDGTITHWDIWPGNPAEGERKFQIVSDAHTGTQAVRIDLHNGNKQAIYQYCVDTSAFDFNESYRASVWMKLKDLKTSELTLTVKRRDSNGNEHNISTALPTATTDGWVLFTLDAPKVKGATIVQYDVVVDIGTGSGSVWLDDFDLVPADLDVVDPGLTGSGLLRNPSLENLNGDGTVTDWDVWPGNPAEGTRRFAVVTDVIHSGGKALRVEPVSGNAHAVYQYCTDTGRFDFNGSYTASVWMKLENVQVSNLTIGVKRKASNGSEYNVYQTLRQGTTDGWVKVQVEVPGLIGATITQYDVIVDIGTGSGRVYLDDFDLTPAALEKKEIKTPLITDSLLRNPSLETLNPDGSVLDWDVWPGNPDEGVRNYEVTKDSHSGDHAIRVNLEFSNAQAVYQYCIDPGRFDFNADYIVTACFRMENVAVYDGNGVTLGVKRTDSLGNVHVTKTDVATGTSDGWFKVTLEAPAFDGVEIVQYDVIVDIGAGSGSVYMDDFDLTPAELENLPNPNAEPEEKPKDNNGIDPTPVQPEEPAPVEQPQEKSGVPVWVIAVIAVGAVLLIGGIVLLVRKKKRG